MKSMLKEGKSFGFGNDSGVVNADYGIVNGDSGNYRKVFTIGRNGCSRFYGIGVHDKPEWVFTVSRSMHVAHRTRFGTPERLVQSAAPAFVNKGMPLMSTLRAVANSKLNAIGRFLGSVPLAFRLCRFFPMVPRQHKQLSLSQGWGWFSLSGVTVWF